MVLESIVISVVLILICDHLIKPNIPEEYHWIVDVVEFAIEMMLGHLLICIILRAIIYLFRSF